MLKNFSGDNPIYERYYRRLDQTLEKPKVKLYTTTALSFLAMALLAWYAIRPTVTTILFLRREIVDKTVINKKMEEKINSLIEAQNNYQTALPRLSLLSEAIPPSANLLPLLAQLKNLTSQNGASLSALRVPSMPLVTKLPVPATDSGKMIDFPVTMLATGSYATLKTVMAELLQMRRLVTLQNLKITIFEEGQSRSATDLQLDLKLNSYFYEEY